MTLSLGERAAARTGPFDTDTAVADITALLRDVYRGLDRCRTLRPSAEVDTLFGRLVQLVLRAPEHRTARVLADPTIQALRPRLWEICAQGEHELEHTWATRIAASSAPHAELGRFPYLDNYRRLSRMELEILATAVRRPIHSIAFVGAGPLPLSGFLLADQLHAPVDNLDRNPDAVASGQRVADVLGVTGFRFWQVDAREADLSSYDLVVLAALVGATPSEKDGVLQHLARSMSMGAVLLARSARGMRTLLYPAIDPGGFKGFDLLAVVHPVHEVINSVILARARG